MVMITWVCISACLHMCMYVFNQAEHFGSVVSTFQSALLLMADLKYTLSCINVVASTDDLSERLGLLDMTVALHNIIKKKV